MPTESILLAGASAAIPATMLDLLTRAIQRWQRSRWGVVEQDTLGPFALFLLHLVLNFTTAVVFVLGYMLFSPGSGRAFVYGGAAWLTVVVPVLALSRYTDEMTRNLLTVRVLSWLFKAGVASAATAYFIG